MYQVNQWTCGWDLPRIQYQVPTNYLSIYADPADIRYTDPAYTRYADPAYTRYADPAYTRYADPAYTRYADPAYIRYADPAYIRYADPAYIRYADPAYTRYADPAYIRYADPAYIRYADPAYTRYANVSYKTSVQFEIHKYLLQSYEKMDPRPNARIFNEYNLSKSHLFQAISIYLHIFRCNILQERQPNLWLVSH
jgi:hypothetical protein